MFLIRIFFVFLIIFFNFISLSFANKIIYLEDNFFPEGITSSNNGDLFVGSLKENKIVKIPNNKNEYEEFIPSNSNGLLSVIGIIADDYNKILWACSSNPGVTNYPVDNPIVALKSFDLGISLITSCFFFEVSSNIRFTSIGLLKKAFLGDSK